MARPPIRWGILGTGAVARVFAQDLRHLSDARLIAVGSRSDERAQAFGGEFNVPRRYARYADLVEDADVDVVYVATPASVHRDNVLLCLAAGKAVLCEKPFTLDGAQAQEIVACAREKRVFLMEAMWTRFLPAMVELRALLEAGAVGTVSHLIGDIGSTFGVRSAARLVDPELGGGALLQRGVYLLSLASMLFGRPNRVTAVGRLMSTGVDDEAAMILGYEGGQLAVLLTSFRARTAREATLTGSAGLIRIGPPVNRPSRLTMTQLRPGGDGHRDRATGLGLKDRLIEYGRDSALLTHLRERFSVLAERFIQGNRRKVIRAPIRGHGLHYEAAEVMRCLRSGLVESPTMSLDESVAIMETADRVRQCLRASA